MTCGTSSRAVRGGNPAILVILGFSCPVQPTPVLSAFLAVLRSFRRLAYRAESSELLLRPVQGPLPLVIRAKGPRPMSAQ